MHQAIKAIIFILLTFGFSDVSHAASVQIDLGSGANELSGAVKIMLLMTLLSLGPAMLLSMTSFTRIIIVLSFLRQAMGTQQSPPNQILIGLSLSLTIFIMNPVIKKVYNDSIEPMMNNKMAYDVAFQNASVPIREFMLRQTRASDLELIKKISKSDMQANDGDLSLTLVIPAFILSELKTAFEIGFMIYLPFVLIDMIVSMILLTMGMMVLPPVVISMPFKLMLFVLVDGWNLMVGSLMGSFR